MDKSGLFQNEESVMQITSPAFEHNQMIPDKFACVGANINPALMLEDVP